MTPLVIAMVLGAALLHASWNAILRGGADRLWSTVVICATSAVVAVPAIFLLPPPAPAAWPFLALSAAMQVAYCLLLVRAYREAGLAQAYPIARGTSPLLVALGAALAAGERLTPATWVGILLVSLGIMALAFEKARPKVKSTLAALGAGVFVSAYTLTDGLGARLSGHALGYTAWLFLTQGSAMTLVYLMMGGRLTIQGRRPETLAAIAAGVFGLVSYAIVVWALSQAPMGQVSALRETSILFAALIGMIFLKEKPTLPRLGAALMIAGGAMMLAMER